MKINRLKWYSDNIMKRDLLYKTICPSLKGNIYAIPKIIKASLNMGSNVLPGSSNQLGSKTQMIQLLSGLELLSGQKVKRTYAKKSIASFKLRKGQCIGGMLTLRRANLFFFLEKFCFIVTPKIREFQHITLKKKHPQKMLSSLDFSGASFLLYPELTNQYESFDGIKGFNVSLTLTKTQYPELLASFFLPA